MPSHSPNGRKVLLVGWDGADWKLINPLLDAGLLPALNRLVNRGVMASPSSLAPMISPVVWTSIATGKRPDRHGVLTGAEPDPARGVLRPVSSSARKTSAIWDILSHAGLNTHVINWYATHPAPALRGASVSDRFPKPVASYGETWPIESDTCWPPRVQSPLAELRVHPGDLCGDQLLSFVPQLAEIDQQQDLRVAAVAAILAETVTVHAAATWLLQHEPWDFLAVHYSGLEQWGHAFMRYCQPRMPGITDRDCELYGEVVSAGYRFHDMMLARLVELAPDDVTVILVSDHGFCTGQFRPRGNAAATASQWHRGRGIFCMSGPSIREDELVHGASVLDVTPTVLTLFGLPVGDDMAGRPLLTAWKEPEPVRHIPSWDDECDRASCSTKADVEPQPELLAALSDLETQGYADDLQKLLAPMSCRAQQVETYHLAVVHLAAGRPDQALPLFEQLHALAPDENTVTLHLSYCHYLLGHYPICRELLSAIDEGTSDHPLQQLLLAMISLAENRPERALEQLRGAKQTPRREPFIICGIGRAYLQLKNYSEAEAAFRRALAIDEDCAAAYFGLALGSLRQQRWEDAADAALHALAINHHHPDAHFLLGVALTQIQRPQRAIQAFETAVSMRPNFTSAHRWLMQLHQQVTRDYPRAEHHRLAAELHGGSQTSVPPHGINT